MINQLRLYLSATILLAACGSIRKNKELQGYNMNTAAISNTNSSLLHTSTINESITDSSAGDYMVQIFPSGYFTYDNGYGYRGMATQVVWKGKTNHKVIANRNQTSLNQMDQKQIVSTRTAKSAFDKKLKKSKWVMPVWVWIVFAMVVLSGWGLMIIKIRKLQVSKFTFAQ